MKTYESCARAAFVIPKSLFPTPPFPDSAQSQIESNAVFIADSGNALSDANHNAS